MCLFLASCLIWPIYLESHFKSWLATPLGVCQPPPPMLTPWPKLNLLSRDNFSMNIAEFLASCLIWPIFLENHFKSRLVKPLWVCQPYVQKAVHPSILAAFKNVALQRHFDILQRHIEIWQRHKTSGSVIWHLKVSYRHLISLYRHLGASFWLMAV